MSERRFTAEVVLPHPPETVFALLSDPRRRPEWQSSLRSVDVPDGEAPGVGLAWRESTLVGVRPSMVVIEHTAPTAWAEEGRWRGISATLRLRLAADPGGCRVRADGEVRGRGAWAVPATLAGALAGRAIAADLVRAGRVLTALGDQV